VRDKRAQREAAGPDLPSAPPPSGAALVRRFDL